VTYIRCRIDIINSPDDGHMAAPKHVGNGIKYTRKRTVGKVGYLQIPFWDLTQRTELPIYAA